MARYVDPSVDAVPFPVCDVDLLRRWRRHAESGAFAELVDRHQADLLRVAHAITGDAQQAEDAVQDSFLSLCREADVVLSAAGERRSLGGWLCAVVRNRCIDDLRRRQPQPLPDQLAQPPATGADAGSLWEAVAALPPLERAAVVLRYRDQLDYRAVAERLGKSVSHVGVILHQAMQRLREHPRLRSEAAS